MSKDQRKLNAEPVLLESRDREPVLIRKGHTPHQSNCVWCSEITWGHQTHSTVFKSGCGPSSCLASLVPADFLNMVIGSLLRDSVSYPISFQRILFYLNQLSIACNQELLW